ncbi:MAG: DUF3563 family protein [Betaproteobacteria bacterium]
MTVTNLPFKGENVLDVIVRMVPTPYFLPDHTVGDELTLRPAAPRATESVWGAAMGALHRLGERFDRWAWDQQMRDREAYLAQSVDVFDLEQRIRTLERGDCR